MMNLNIINLILIRLIGIIFIPLTFFCLWFDRPVPWSLLPTVFMGLMIISCVALCCLNNLGRLIWAIMTIICVGLQGWDMFNNWNNHVVWITLRDLQIKNVVDVLDYLWAILEESWLLLIICVYFYIPSVGKNFRSIK
ncbi:MAG: hypothetical protein HQL23_05760 [Candidatus Omnitrophica bacterium]|nr:hypothetical protein [Candidatus Omnitrophota bacterium]